MSDIPSSDKASKVAIPNLPGNEQPLSDAPPSESRRRKLLVAIVTSICLYIFLQYASKQNFFRHLTIFEGNKHPTVLKHPHHGISETDFTLERCLQDVDWSPPLVWHPDPTSPRLIAPKFPAFATLEIPITSIDLASTMLNFVSHYPGTFKMITSPHQAKDLITFNITDRQPAPELRSSRSAKICVISSRERGKGVGIFNPRQRQGCQELGNRRRDQFDTTLILPESTEDSIPLSILGFRSEVVDTAQVIGDIGSKVFFNNINLNGNYQPIQIESLSANYISIHSKGGPIRGIFNYTTGLSLITDNSPILVDVNLNSTGHGTSRFTPFFIAQTTNSPIKAMISLFSEAGHQDTGPSFSVAAQTTNSPIDLSFKTAPLDSALTVTASTTNGPATVNAHPTYEGSFILNTTVMEPEINDDPRVVDPSGKGRSRNYQYSSVTSGQISGKVHWGEEPSPPNRPYPLPAICQMVMISTTNSHAILNL